jgi:hypothetical protein
VSSDDAPVTMATLRSLSERAARAHEFATRLMGPPSGDNLWGKTPAPDFKVTLKGQWLRMPSARAV